MQSPRRHPRTLEEAFGPYTRGAIDEPYEPMPMIDKIVLIVSTIVGACTLAAIFTGVI
jgi:hypothetical protein